MSPRQRGLWIRSPYLHVRKILVRPRLRLVQSSCVRPISSAAIEVDQNIPWFGAFARTNDAAVFQLVHDTGGAAIAQAQAPLQQRHAGFLLAANDLDALLDNFLVFIDPAFVVKIGDRFGKLL